MLPILAEVVPLGGGEYRVKPRVDTLGTEQWVNTESAAKFLRMPRNTLTHWCARGVDGMFRVRKIKGRWQVELSSVAEFLRRAEARK